MNAYMHKGIILNVEAFGGMIELWNLTVTNNYFFIPEIFPVNYSYNTNYSMQPFINNYTKELEFSGCNTFERRN